MTSLYLGIMSGTSLDGVDLALVDFATQTQILATDFTPMPPLLREKLTQLITQGESSLQQLGELDRQLAQLYADCVNHFLQKYGFEADEIVAIGCHGQTVWHSPQGALPFTLQLGDMNLLAAQTGITVVGDFRRKDMAFGGQGAPLVPAFHQAVFASEHYATAVLNIGGISNLSLLLPNQAVIGFDCGVGNALLDSWIARHLGLPFDEYGRWADSGKVNEELLALLLDEPFFSQPPPKSTGRELFNLTWLEKKLTQLKTPGNFAAPLAQDVQATLVAFTAKSVKLALDKVESALPKRLLVCGGGAKNHALIRALRQFLPDWWLQITSEIGIDADFVEAAAFAWLACQRWLNLPGNLPSVTGASQPTCLGAIYLKE